MVRPPSTSPSPSGEVMALPVQRSDADLVNGLKAGDAWARVMLFDRFGVLVERLVRRILGHERHTDIADVVHDAFVAVFSSVHTLKSPEALVSWIQSVATHTACKAIRRRRARAWLRFVAPEDLPDGAARPPSEETVEAHDRTYRILERFSAPDRAIFALRFIDGMPLADVASACGISLATAKRRLARAERRFVVSASCDPVLAPWVRKGDRWTP
ncbi:MAG: sigma-70 family RNA polymerase sigma factor [Polyangiaceae bacterium]|nr:sigma-70 family RNA polymerase sigma factor [Polyangiaceae bacterium]